MFCILLGITDLHVGHMWLDSLVWAKYGCST